MADSSLLFLTLSLDFILWRRQWQPTPVLLPGKSHGLRGMVGFSPWGREDSDMTERLSTLTLLLHLPSLQSVYFID